MDFKSRPIIPDLFLGWMENPPGILCQREGGKVKTEGETENFPGFFGSFSSGMLLFPMVDIQVWNTILPRFPTIPSPGMHFASPGFPQSQFHASPWSWIFGIFGNGMQIVWNESWSIKSHMENSPSMAGSLLPLGNSVGLAATEIHMDQLGADSRHPDNWI